MCFVGNILGVLLWIDFWVCCLELIFIWGLGVNKDFSLDFLLLIMKVGNEYVY